MVLGGIFNAFPYTTYSQNVGLVQLTGVRNRVIIYTCGGMLIVLGFIPKIAAITTIIPKSVLGGAMLAMFGMVMAYGIKMLSSVDFGRQENLLIVACSVGIGLGVTVVPTLFSQLPESIRILTDNGIVLGSASAVLLNIVFNMVPQRKVKVKRRAGVYAKCGKRSVKLIKVQIACDLNLYLCCLRDLAFLFKWHHLSVRTKAPYILKWPVLVT